MEIDTDQIKTFSTIITVISSISLLSTFAAFILSIFIYVEQKYQIMLLFTGMMLAFILNNLGNLMGLL
jgi:hypothetical protein